MSEPVVAKYDYGKADVFQGVFRYFPRALKAVAAVSEAGAKKYSWSDWMKGWAQVPNGFLRYSSAMARHILAEAEEDYDEECETLHAANAAWNALARLELLLQKLPAKKPGVVVGYNFKAPETYLDGTPKPANGRYCSEDSPGL